MKQFSLNEYLKNQSRKVVTRDGRPVRIICTDAKIYYPVIALIEEEGVEHVFSYLPDGTFGSISGSGKYDLFFDTERKEGWINLYRTERGQIIAFNVLETKEKALEEVKSCILRHSHIGTIKIQWEE